MQTGTLMSAVVAPVNGQPGAQNSGAAGAGSFTQVLMAVLGGAAAGRAPSPTPGVAGAGQTDSQTAGQGSATTGNAADDNPGDGQDAGIGPIANPATEIAAANNVASGAPGLEVAGVATANGQANAQEPTAEATQTHVNGLALAGQVAGGETGDAPTTQEVPNQVLGSLLAGGSANSDSTTGTNPEPAATGETASPANESSAILIVGVDGPQTAVAEGPDRLGVAVEAPSTDKSTAVAAQTAIQTSALNKAPSKLTDTPATTDQGTARGAGAQTASIGDSATDGSGDRPPMPQTANPELMADGEAEAAFKLSSSANELATHGNAAANAHIVTSASAHASAHAGDGTNASAQPARPANPALVNAQVAVQITRAAAEGMDRIIIQLQPESLGRVDVKIEISNDGRMTATILAEKTDTLHMLQRDARGLERALQDAGLETDSGSLSFHLRGHGGDGTEFAQHRNEYVAGDGGADNGLARDEFDEPGGAKVATYVGNGLLDIHV